MPISLQIVCLWELIEKRTRIFYFVSGPTPKIKGKNDKRRHKWRLSTMYTLIQPQEQAKNVTVNWVLNIHEDSSNLLLIEDGKVSSRGALLRDLLVIDDVSSNGIVCHWSFSFSGFLATYGIIDSKQWTRLS